MKSTMLAGSSGTRRCPLMEVSGKESPAACDSGCGVDNAVSWAVVWSTGPGR